MSTGQGDAATGGAQGAGSGEGGAAGGQAQGAGAAGDQGAQGAPGAGGGQAQGAGDQGQGSGIPQRTPEEWAAREAERERENAELREFRRQAQAAEQERQRQGMTDAERTAAAQADRDRETAELRAELAATRIESSAAGLATDLGFRSPTLAGRLLTPTQRQEVLREDGTVDSDKLKKALQAELKDHPELGGATAGADGGKGRGQQGGDDMNSRIRRAAGHGGGG